MTPSTNAWDNLSATAPGTFTLTKASVPAGSVHKYQVEVSVALTQGGTTKHTKGGYIFDVEIQLQACQSFTINAFATIVNQNFKDYEDSYFEFNDPESSETVCGAL